MKKKKSFIKCLVMSLLGTAIIVACGNDEKETSTSYRNSGYSLTYKNVSGTSYFDWDWSNFMGLMFITLEFEEGIPTGSIWRLNCDADWVNLERTYGKKAANIFYSENIIFNLTDNTNYEDREAHIYLEVENGLPVSGNRTTVNIHQYGYEHYFNLGPAISFETNRSQAKDNLLKLNITNMNNVVEIDWGDSNKEVYNINDSYHLVSHAYSSSSNTYLVKLRFGGEPNKSSFSFYTNADQGISTFYNRQGSRLMWFANNASKKRVSYKNGNFTIDAY